MDGLLDGIVNIFSLGGWVMYPLALLSVISLAATLERLVFWARFAGPSARAGQLASRLLDGNVSGLEKAPARGLYGGFVLDLLRGMGGPTRLTEAIVVDLIERRRPAIERFGTLMSTIISAAPMLGILGTVTGIIRSFKLMGATASVNDPTAVAGGIAEALFTTAFGLIVALVTLFPYAAFRARAERALARLEALGAAAVQADARQRG